MRFTRRFLTQAILGAAASRLVFPRQGPTFSTEVKVVNILATVRDKSGKIVRDLNKEDFAVSEDGHPQVIKYFSRESDLPLTIGLMVDTSFSQGAVLDSEIGASYRFLDQVLREKEDKAVVVQFDQTVIVRQGLTSSHKDLQDVLSLLGTPSAQAAAFGSGTLLYDAVRKACLDIMRTQQGRKALMVLTDGNDEGSVITLDQAIDAAEKAETLVYCILFSDPSYYAGGTSGRRVLERMAQETGGGFFAVSKKMGVQEIYAAIEEELRSEYSIGFVSDRPITSSGFRKLKVTTKEKGLVVQARSKYYAET